jgi:hypothetical protein
MGEGTIDLRVHRHRHVARRTLDEIAKVASLKVVLPMALVTAWALGRRRGAVRLAVGTACAIASEEVLKRVVHRHRPRLFSGSAWRSFPSGHSAGATAYLLGTGLSLPRAYRPAALALSALAIAAVNWLRVSARDHWTGDVLAGDLLGVGALGISHVAIEKLGTSRRSSKPDSSGGKDEKLVRVRVGNRPDDRLPAGAELATRRKFAGRAQSRRKPARSGRGRLP